MDFTDEQLAVEAERLLKDPVLNLTVSRIMADSLQELAAADATDADAIRKSQATYRAAEEFMLRLHRYVEALNADGDTTQV